MISTDALAHNAPTQGVYSTFINRTRKSLVCGHQYPHIITCDLIFAQSNLVHNT